MERCADSELASDIEQLNIVWLLRAYRRDISTFVDGKWLQYYSWNYINKHHRASVQRIRTHRAATHDK